MVIASLDLQVVERTTSNYGPPMDLLGVCDRTGPSTMLSSRNMGRLVSAVADASLLHLGLQLYLAPKVETIAFLAVYSGFGPLFYIVWGV